MRSILINQTAPSPPKPPSAPGRVRQGQPLQAEYPALAAQFDGCAENPGLTTAMPPPPLCPGVTLALRQLPGPRVKSSRDRIESSNLGQSACPFLLTGHPGDWDACSARAGGGSRRPDITAVGLGIAPHY